LPAIKFAGFFYKKAERYLLELKLSIEFAVWGRENRKPIKKPPDPIYGREAISKLEWGMRKVEKIPELSDEV
jgi:hypothetical protein